MKLLMLWQVIDTNQNPTETAFYWAETRDEAIDLHTKQIYNRRDDLDYPLRAYRVWASNEDFWLRGYLTKETN